MSPNNLARRDRGLTLRQAALVAGFAYLLNPVSYAEFSAMPRLVVPGDIERTVQSISAHGTLFAVAILCYLVSFIGDIVIAWALYFLLAPVHRALSLLASWFQLVYAAMGLVSVLNLVTVFRLVRTPEYLALFGSGSLRAQVDLLLHSFRYGWSISLAIFGIHLVLIGGLIYRSRYIPRLIGVLLVFDGLGWVVDGLRPYFFPDAPLGFIIIMAFSELLFMLWLLLRGWFLQESGNPF